MVGKINDCHSIMKSIKAGKNIKSFTKSKGLCGEISYDMNEIVITYQNEILELKNIEKANKELLTSLSHELRTPLTSLLGYLDAVYDSVVQGDEREEYIKIAWCKAYDLKKYTDTFFDWFKINANEKIYNFELIDIYELTRKIMISWLRVLAENDISVNIIIPEVEQLIYIDKTAYLRIINNLLKNVLIHGQSSYLEIKMEALSASVQITVSDNGVGIGAEDIPYIFTRLYKGNKSRGVRGSSFYL